MTHFPLFANLADQPCLVVGGGEVAARKVARLLRAGARVTVNAPRLCHELAARATSGEIRHVADELDTALIPPQLLVIAATSDRAVNRRVADAAAMAKRLCNVVDDGELSTCIMPAVVDRSPLVIAVSSAGQSPVLARRLRQQIEAWLPSRIGELAAWAGAWREAVRERIHTHAGRLRFWERVFDRSPARAMLAGDRAAADEHMRHALETVERRTAPIGAAWFVGAGPGDPGLITRRGLQLLQDADVVLHDRLVSPDILEFARRDARLISVGKLPGGPSTAQDRINARLVDLVAAGHRVCRLKGGDPFIFGRGAEEVAAVAGAGHAYEVVPGITAGVGCAAATGIPLTHRDFSSAVTFVTANRAGGAGADDPDWPLLARGRHTLVIYMGVRRLADISGDLIRHGRAAATPAALIENGTTDRQRVVGGRLDEIASLATAAAVRPPAILVVGDVVDIADKLDWIADPDAAGRMPAVASR